jgi:hypothetical protein
MQAGTLQQLATGFSEAFSSAMPTSSISSVGSRQPTTQSTSTLKPVHQQTVRQQLLLLQQQSALRQLGIDVNAKLNQSNFHVGGVVGPDVTEASHDCDSSELNDFLA